MKPIIEQIEVFLYLLKKTTKTTRVMTSCMTFNCNNVNGPPFPLKPIRLAGTWKQYSKRAIPQLIRMITNRGSASNHLNSRIFKWPYHAKVIKTLEMTSIPMVRKIFIMFYTNYTNLYELHELRRITRIYTNYTN